MSVIPLAIQARHEVREATLSVAAAVGQVDAAMLNLKAAIEELGESSTANAVLASLQGEKDVANNLAARLADHTRGLGEWITAIGGSSGRIMTVEEQAPDVLFKIFTEHLEDPGGPK